MNKKALLAEKTRLEELLDFYMMRVFFDDEYLLAAIKVKKQIKEINKELEPLE